MANLREQADMGEFTTYHDETGKVCTRCRTYKPFADYYAVRRRPGAYTSLCKVCHRGLVHASGSQRRWRERALAEGRSLDAALYKVPAEELQRWRRIASCQCCGRDVSRDDRTQHLDHQHGTQRIRGVLCPGCNTGIGKLGDDVDGLERAQRYLMASVDVLALAQAL